MCESNEQCQYRDRKNRLLADKIFSRTILIVRMHVQ